MGKNKNELIIHVMHGYDSIETPEGEKCFGCYINGQHEIWIADDIPEGQFFHTLAHEYKHYLQDIENREFNEEEANEYADSIFKQKEIVHVDNISLIDEIKKLIQEEDKRKS